MTSAEFRREKMARREEHECTAMKDEIQELKVQNEKTKTELLAQMELEIRKINDQNEQTKTELLAQMGTLEGEVHELKNLLRQLVDK